MTAPPYADRRFTPAMAFDAIVHDPKNGQFTSAQATAHEHLIKHGHEHTSFTPEPHNIHNYIHQGSKVSTEVYPNGEGSFNIGGKTQYFVPGQVPVYAEKYAKSQAVKHNVREPKRYGPPRVVGGGGSSKRD